MKLYIKYMVSLRCKMIVREELQKLGLHDTTIDLGMVEISEDMTSEHCIRLKENLKIFGLELLDDKKSMEIPHNVTTLFRLNVTT